MKKPKLVIALITHVWNIDYSNIPQLSANLVIQVPEKDVYNNYLVELHDPSKIPLIIILKILFLRPIKYLKFDLRH